MVLVKKANKKQNKKMKSYNFLICLIIIGSTTKSKMIFFPLPSYDNAQQNKLSEHDETENIGYVNK